MNNLEWNEVDIDLKFMFLFLKFSASYAKTRQEALDVTNK